VRLKPIGRVARIQHPQLPEVFMEVEELDPADDLRLRGRLKAMVRPIAIVDPRDGELIKDVSGEPFYHLAQTEDYLEATQEFLMKAVRKVGGIEDEDGKPVERVDIQRVYQMMDPALRVRQVLKDPMTGEVRVGKDGEPRTYDVSWPAYVVERLRDPATYGETDPEGKV